MSRYEPDQSDVDPGYPSRQREEGGKCLPVALLLLLSSAILALLGRLLI